MGEFFAKRVHLRKLQTSGGSCYFRQYPMTPYVREPTGRPYVDRVLLVRSQTEKPASLISPTASASVRIVASASSAPNAYLFS